MSDAITPADVRAASRAIRALAVQPSAPIEPEPFIVPGELLPLAEYAQWLVSVPRQCGKKWANAQILRIIEMKCGRTGCGTVVRIDPQQETRPTA